MQQVNALIWDLDGVLVDSEHYHYRAWRETMRLLHYDEMSLVDFRRTFGMRNVDLLRGVLGLPLSEAQANDLADMKEARYRELVRSEGMQLLPGVQTWLAAAHLAGWLQAVASSAPRANVETVVDAVKIRHFFGALICAEDVRHGKPDPEVYLTAARKLGVTPTRCIVIEDAPSGTQGARAGGMASIGVLTTHTELVADLVLPDLADVPFEAVCALLDNH